MSYPVEGQPVPKRGGPGINDPMQNPNARPTYANLEPHQNITDPPITNPMQYLDTEDPRKLAAFKAINDEAFAMYTTILESAPRCAERTLAIRKLQEARMWANAAVVFDGRSYPT